MTDASGFAQIRLFNPYAVDTYTTYTVLYNNTPGKFTFFAAGQQLPIAPNAEWVPLKGEAVGETHTLASQMPGQWSFPQYFSGTNIWYSNARRPFDGQLFASNWSYFYVAVWGPGTEAAILDQVTCPQTLVHS